MHGQCTVLLLPINTATNAHSIWFQLVVSVNMPDIIRALCIMKYCYKIQS